MSNKDNGRLTDSVFTEKEIQNHSDHNPYFKAVSYTHLTLPTR